MLICEQIGIAVDFVDCLDEFGSDCLGLIQQQGRGQQFHACQAVFGQFSGSKPYPGIT